MQESVLIADDEPPARRTLRRHLMDLGWTGDIHEAGDGHAAIAFANQSRPALIFLDIVMPGASGLEVLEGLAYQPQIIFTTAFDQYAIRAFELGALDYLLKPFGRERLATVLRRAQAVLSSPEASLLSRARESFQRAGTLSKVFVRDGNRIMPIQLSSVERVQASDDYVTIHSVEKQFLISVRLSDLEERLVGRNFLRMHRSHLINLEYVTSIEPHDPARLQVVMKSGARIVASRAGSKRLRDLAL